MWVWRKRRNRPDDAAAVSERASAETALIRPAVSGLYVDMENLQGQDFAQRFLANLVQNWPSDVPPLGVVRLYVRADTQVLWEMWMESQFADVGVSVRGIQHFSKNASKNSADIALSLDAICDLMTDRVQHVVVVSDDSDFVALFGKIHELHKQADSSQTPFLWIMTNRDHTRSQVVESFFPNIYIRKIDIAPRTSEDDNPTQSDAGRSAQLIPSDSVDGNPSNNEVAMAIIQDIPVGQFRSTECHPIIKEYWPSCDLATLDSAQFGQQLIAHILPILKKYGVTRNPTSRQYEMTENAKEQLRVQLVRLQLD